jgi:hypothetical protein
VEILARATDDVGDEKLVLAVGPARLQPPKLGLKPAGW